MEYPKIHMGQKVQEVLRKKGITPAQLGKKIGISGFSGRNTVKQRDMHATKIREISLVLDHDLTKKLNIPARFEIE